jgi:drug/metabolite transporter (DMT)-like permease
MEVPNSRVKTRVLILIVIVTSAVGNVFLSKGMKQVGPLSLVGLADVFPIAATVLLNPWIIAGMVLLTVFFISFLTVLSWADLSYVLPATAPSYLLVAGLSWWLLGESISGWRWLGTVLIVAGVALVVSRSEVRTT